MTTSPSSITAFWTERDWVIDSPPIPGRALGIGGTINWEISNRTSGGKYSGINTRLLAGDRRSVADDARPALLGAQDHQCLNKLPKGQQSKDKPALQESWTAETKKDAHMAFEA